MQAEAEALEMKMKGYTYQQETSRQVGMEAMKNGIGGRTGGGAGIITDLAGMGIGLGAMGGVIGMTKDAMKPVVDSAQALGQMTETTISGGAAPDTWDCSSCGKKGISTKFCPECGSRKQEIAEDDDSWVCPECGTKGITSRFCPECGCKRPDKLQLWNCPGCGKQGNATKFCPECGTKRPE